MAKQEKAVTPTEGMPRSEYLVEHYRLVESQYSSSRAFDKWVLTLAGGSFTLSLSFMQNLAKDSPRAGWSLIVGWSALIATVLSTLLSFRTSYKAHDVEIDNLRADYELKPRKANRWSCATRVLNWFSATAFTTGLGGLAVFALVNLLR